MYVSCPAASKERSDLSSQYKDPFTPSVSVNSAMTLAILFSLKNKNAFQ